MEVCPHAMHTGLAIRTKASRGETRAIGIESGVLACVFLFVLPACSLRPALLLHDDGEITLLYIYLQRVCVCLVVCDHTGRELVSLWGIGRGPGCCWMSMWAEYQFNVNNTHITVSSTHAQNNTHYYREVGKNRTHDTTTVVTGSCIALSHTAPLAKIRLEVGEHRTHDTTFLGWFSCALGTS